MAGRNQTGSASTSQAESLLLRFLGVHECRPLLLIPFFFLYLLTITANSILTCTVGVEEDLRSPMYSLITLLLTVSLCRSSTFSCWVSPFISTTSRWEGLHGPDLLPILLHHAGVQHPLSHGHRYVAICNPLHYTDIMTRKYLSRLSLAAAVRDISFVSPVVILASKCTCATLMSSRTLSASRWPWRACPVGTPPGTRW